MRVSRPSARGAVVALLLWFSPSASAAGVAAGALAIAAPGDGHHRVAVRPCAARGLDVVVAHVEPARTPPESDHVVRCVEVETHGTRPRALDLPAPFVLLATLVIGGILSSTALTLVVLPALLRLLARRR